MLLAIFDGIKSVLEWVDQYGADKVFMVVFALMYIRSQRRVANLQDARLEDSKKAIEALIEARYAFTEMHELSEEMNKALRERFAQDVDQFGKIRGRLDRLGEKVDNVKETLKEK